MQLKRSAYSLNNTSSTNTNLASLLRIAASLLRRSGAFVPRDELQSIVGISYAQAASTFDAARGTEFTTYAFTYLRGNLCAYYKERKKQATLLADYGAETQIYARGENLAELVERRQLRQFLCRVCAARFSGVDRKVAQSLFTGEEGKIWKQIGVSKGHFFKVRRAVINELRKEMGK